jgi:hypothetical protein
MEGRFFLDIVIRKGVPIFKQLPCKDETLLVRWDPMHHNKISFIIGKTRSDCLPFVVLNLRFDVVNHVGQLNLKGNGLAGVGQGTSVLELFAHEDQVLLIRGRRMCQR